MALNRLESFPNQEPNHSSSRGERSLLNKGTMPNKAETSRAKLAGYETAKNEEPLTRTALKEKFPEAVRFEGTFGTEGEDATGIVGKNEQGDVVCTAIDPKWILKHPGSDEFGGKQTLEHVQPYLLRRKGREKAAEMANAALQALIEKKPVVAVGDEDEGWMVDTRLGCIIPLSPEDQDEQHRGLLEESQQPKLTIEESMLQRARMKRELQERMPQGVLHVNSSVPPVGSFHRDHKDEGLLRNNGKLKQYIRATSTHMHQVIGFFDPEATQLANYLAEKSGYKDAEELLTHTGDVTILLFAAKHRNQGVVHFREKPDGTFKVVPFEDKDGQLAETINDEINHDTQGKLVVPTENVIAQANISTSTSGVIKSWLNFNTPMILGYTPQLDVQRSDGSIVSVWPMDYRADNRHVSLTTIPGKPIKSPDDLTARIVSSITSGDISAADKAGFIAEVPKGSKGRLPEKESYPSSHGPTRLRAATDKPMVRVEETDMPAGPSPLDEYAANCLAEIDMYAALLAVASKQTVEEFYKGSFPSLTESDNRLRMEKEYNHFGADGEGVKDLIDEKIRHLNFMEESFPHLKDHIAVAKVRIQNLLVPTTARTFDELYEQGHHGQVSEVAKNMIRDGATPHQVTIAQMEYQKKTFADLEAKKGDAAVVLGLKSAAQ